VTSAWGVDDLTVRFGARTALDRVTFDLPPGEVSAVVGGDGAGKTTLLRTLVGVLAATSGTVRRPDDRRIGYLASASGTYPDLTVDENLAFTATAYGVDPAEARARSADLLERTGLAAARGRLAAHLSGGMRRKLGVVQALQHRPDLLVLDEPTTGIDPVSRADLWGLIARAAADGAAVVFTTTYLDEAERAGRVLVLDTGRTLAAGRPADVVASMPGRIVSIVDRPAGADEAGRAWRRRARWRVWDPAGGPAGVDGAVEPDLQDAVTVFILRRQLQGVA
jgi:ABC-2 type transport system ATP-binding protein